MIRVPRSHCHVTAQTHPGMAGKQNEDRFAVSSYRLGLQNPTPSLLAVVADGIGGHRAGEVAAEIAVNTISHLISLSDGTRPLETLQHAIQVASQEIARQAKNNNQLGMGTTCACAWIIGDRLYTASVGDSRIYLLQNGSLHRLTTDHTWVQEALEKGLLDAASARHHPNCHVIRRYLGSEEPPLVDLRLRLNGDKHNKQAQENQGMRLSPQDVLLLCTDGLTDRVEDGEIETFLRTIPWSPATDRQLTTTARNLVNLACQRGGRDNITVVMIAIPRQPDQEAKRRERFLSRLWK